MVNFRKNVPLAIFSGVLIVVCFYLLVNFGFLCVLTNEEIKSSTLLINTFAFNLAGSIA